MNLSRLITVAAIAIAVTYVMFAVLVFLLQRRLLYPAPEASHPPVLKGGEILRIQDGDRTVTAFFIPAKERMPTVVHFHGNAEQLADLVPLAAQYSQVGIGFMGVEYPGYGLDRSGRTTETSLLGAAEAGLRYLRETLHVPSAATVLEGQSIGSGIAVQMAAQGYGARLVLISPYTSIADVAVRAMPWLPVKWLVLDKFDSAGLAPRIEVPVMIVHGTADEIIPFELGRKLSQLFSHAELVSVAGAGHNDVLDHSGVNAKIQRFVIGSE
jgi:uncharacterized protein